MLIKILFYHLPRIPHGQENTIWLELFSGTEKTTSEYFMEQKILTTEIVIPLKRRADRHLVLLLHCSRGLEYIGLGEYYIDCPKKGTSCEFKEVISCHDSRRSISMRVTVEELLGRGVEHKSFHLNR
jgi:hypothetical protein